MDLREYTRHYAVQDNRLAALSYFGTFAVYFASLSLAIVFVDRWYIMIPAGIVFAFRRYAFMCCNMIAGTIRCLKRECRTNGQGMVFRHSPLHRSR